MLKAAVKASPAEQVRHRVVPPEAVIKMGQTLDGLKSEIQEVLKEEKEEKAVRSSFFTSSLADSLPKATDADHDVSAWFLRCVSPRWRSPRVKT